MAGWGRMGGWAGTEGGGWGWLELDLIQGRGQRASAAAAVHKALPVGTGKWGQVHQAAPDMFIPGFC